MKLQNEMAVLIIGSKDVSQQRLSLLKGYFIDFYARNNKLIFKVFTMRSKMSLQGTMGHLSTLQR